VGFREGGPGCRIANENKRDNKLMTIPEGPRCHFDLPLFARKRGVLQRELAIFVEQPLQCYTKFLVCECLIYMALKLGGREGANTREKSVHLAVSQLI
jgi:hypothetical protein